MRATKPNGALLPIPDCYIKIPVTTSISEMGGTDRTFENGEKIHKIEMRILPDISDAKSANYNDEPIIGRSSPMKTYSHSENRTINWTAHFIICEEIDKKRNFYELRAIQSVVYPRDENIQPFAPPPVCSIKCGWMLGKDELCVVLRSYSVKYPVDVPWDEEYLMPYKFSVDMQWDVVYESGDKRRLPGQEKIYRGE